ncbi:Hypothetical protein NGAL_HAMBI490_00060 [Neorhizobium galegae bv. officinalis]|nr:Hypothetical protein NGAL_HAMBI490_00060 [Neorhizobium galegae bv. officinalis]
MDAGSASVAWIPTRSLLNWRLRFEAAEPRLTLIAPGANQATAAYRSLAKVTFVSEAALMMPIHGKIQREGEIVHLIARQLPRPAGP